MQFGELLSSPSKSTDSTTGGQTDKASFPKIIALSIIPDGLEMSA